MKDLWQHYLEQQLPPHEISNVVVYTDHHRYWLADGLLEYADSEDWNASVRLLEDLEDEDAMEMKHSFAALPSDTLLACFFSDKFPYLDLLNHLWSPIKGVDSFRGYSIITPYAFPDQYFAHFLESSLFDIDETEQTVMDLLYAPQVNLSHDNGSFLELSLGKIESYPYSFMDNQHVFFPITEVVAEVNSIEGMFVIDTCIGEVVEQQELVDPMGRVADPIQILIEDNIITDIRGDGTLIDRLHNLIREGNEIKTASLGLAPVIPATGFIQVDRLIKNRMTLSTKGEKIEMTGKIALNEVLNG